MWPGQFGESNVYHQDSYLRQRWGERNALRNDIMKKWIEQYVTSLQERAKWHIKNNEDLIGKIVLVKDHGVNLKKYRWPLGKIERVESGTDKLARTAIIRTARGEERRSIRDLYPLECCN